MSTASPPMNPEVARLRRASAQRKYRKQLRYVRMLWALAGLLLLTLLIEVLIALMSSPRFWIYRLQVSGVETLSMPEVIRLIALPAHSNYYRVSLGALEARIGREQRVEEAIIDHGSVGVLRVHIRERQALCRLGYAYPPLYLDQSGFIFTRPVAPASPVPTVEGIAATGKSPGQQLSSDQGRTVLDFLNALKEASSSDTPLQVARIIISPDGRMTLALRQGTKVYLGQPDYFPAKLLVVRKTIIQASNQGHALDQLEYIDVRGVDETSSNGFYKAKANQEGAAQ